MPNTHSTLTGLFSDIADSIRAKTGGTDDIVADNFPSAISSIPSGTTVQTYEGTFSTDENGEATVNCGFKPDIVVMPYGEYTDETGAFSLDFVFPFFCRETHLTPSLRSIEADLVPGDVANVTYFAFFGVANDTGFSVQCLWLDYSMEFHAKANETDLPFTAIKFTP